MVTYVLPLFIHQIDIFFINSVGHLVRHSNFLCQTSIRNVWLSDSSYEFRHHCIGHPHFVGPSQIYSLSLPLVALPAFNSWPGTIFHFCLHFYKHKNWCNMNMQNQSRNRVNKVKTIFITSSCSTSNWRSFTLLISCLHLRSCELHNDPERPWNATTDCDEKHVHVEKKRCVLVRKCCIRMAKGASTVMIDWHW